MPFTGIYRLHFSAYYIRNLSDSHKNYWDKVFEVTDPKFLGPDNEKLLLIPKNPICLVNNEGSFDIFYKKDF